MSDLILALPARGRMSEQAMVFLAGAGLQIGSRRGDRSYRGRLAGVAGVEVIFLRSGEIPGSLTSGQSHLGITGDDLVWEAGGYGARVCRLRGFDFGRARLAVAVPVAWIDVSTMADLEEVTASLSGPVVVATKYQRLAADFLTRHGIGSFHLVASQGATEGTIAAGVSDIIVDIYSSGRTLAANGLKPLSDGEILSSSAALMGSRRAEWSDQHLAIGEELLACIDARIRGLERAVLHHDPAIEPTADAVARYGLTPLAGTGQTECPAEHVSAVARELVCAGSARVQVARPERIFTPAPTGLASLVR